MNCVVCGAVTERWARPRFRYSMSTSQVWRFIDESMSEMPGGRYQTAVCSDACLAVLCVATPCLEAIRVSL